MIQVFIQKLRFLFLSVIVHIRYRHEISVNKSTHILYINRSTDTRLE